MVATGIRKAALLLKRLDPDTAGKLLKAAPPETVTQIAAELVYLDVAGHDAEQQANQHAAEFLGLLRGKKKQVGQSTDFVRDMVTHAVGKEKSQEILNELDRLVQGRDPFIAIRSAPVESLARALAGHHAQVAAIVLMELPPARSARLFPLIEESVQAESARRMACGESVSPEAKARVAAIIQGRLEALQKVAASPAAVAAAAEVTPEARLRQVALLLRHLTQPLRDTLIGAITQHNAEVGASVQNLMVTWEDLRFVSDRNLQEALRSTEARKLALALHECDPRIKARIRSNMSERGRALIDEEISLMKAPKAEEVEEAREAILAELRQANASGELRFEEATADGAARAH